MAHARTHAHQEKAAKVAQEAEDCGRSSIPADAEGVCATGAPSVKDRAAGAGVQVGRNDPCPCGSGKKSKKCCG